MRTRARLLQVFVATCLLGAFLASPAAGSDDSNSQDLSKISAGGGTVSSNSSSILSTLDELSEGVNDPQFDGLLTQFESQVQSGDNAGAALTLTHLQNYVDSPEGRSLPVSLKDFVKSLSVGPNGLSLDADHLRSLIGSFDPSSGLPTGMAGMDPVQAAQDLSVLSNGLRGIDPSLANDLSQESLWVDQLISSGFFPDISPSGENGGIKPPGLSYTGLNPPGIGSVSPSAGAFSPLAGVPGLPGSPADPTILVPILLAVLIGCIILLKRRNLSDLLSKRVSPDTVLQPEESDEGLNRHNPRDLIIMYFRRAVRLMWRRGTPKFLFETHREFSHKCGEKPEGSQVAGISGLYEKAMFSGRNVTMTEAEDAGRLLQAIEKGEPRQKQAVHGSRSSAVSMQTSNG